MSRSAALLRLPLKLRPFALPALLLVALEFWTRTAGQGSDAVAPPSLALVALMRALGDGSLLAATAFTLGSAALGLAIGSLAGLLLGTVLGLSRRTAAAGFLSIELLRPIPSIALVPLAMLVFGFGLRMQISVVAFATFWPALVLSQAAVRQIEPGWLEVARVLQLSQSLRFTQIILPAMLPRLFVALRLGVAIALVVAVTVEISANPHGMGYALIVAQQSLDPALMMAWLFWIGLAGFAINAAALRLQQALARRRGEVA
jgi:sulfonate transport system permease protein